MNNKIRCLRVIRVGACSHSLARMGSLETETGVMPPMKIFCHRHEEDSR